MKMSSFGRLHYAARIGRDFDLVVELGEKRDHITVYFADIPHLVAAFKRRRQEPREDQPNIVLEDRIPGIRLAAACEGLANSLYAACDIAATFANRAHDAIPSRFNSFCIKVKAGELGADLVGGADNLEWYKRIREIRTEWTHHSTIFIGRDGAEPVLVVKPLRRRGDRVLLPEKTILSVQELLDWSRRAVQTVDRFALEVYRRYSLPKLDLDAEVSCPVWDERGHPVLDGNRLVMKTVTTREYLRAGDWDV